MYKVADIVFNAVDCGRTFAVRSCKYRVPCGRPEFTITLPEEELRMCEEEAPAPRYVHEYLLSGTKFYFGLIRRHGMLLHSSAVVKDGKAYLFTANSGVGKSTHTGYWLELFPDAYILNDDKPAIRCFDDGIYVYGTPWSGKHDISRNEKVRLGGIAVVERADSNFIEPMPPASAAVKILSQTVRKIREERMVELLTTLDRVLREVPVYRLGCINDKSAAEVSSRVMLSDPAVPVKN